MGVPKSLPYKRNCKNKKTQHEAEDSCDSFPPMLLDSYQEDSSSGPPLLMDSYHEESCGRKPSMSDSYHEDRCDGTPSLLDSYHEDCCEGSRSTLNSNGNRGHLSPLLVHTCHVDDSDVDKESYGGHRYDVECSLEGKMTCGTVDSGAQVTVVSHGLLHKLGINPRIKETEVSMKNANGNLSQPLGKFVGRIELKGRSFFQEIFVLSCEDQNLLLLGTDFSYNARLVIDFYERTVHFRDEYSVSRDNGRAVMLDIYEPPRPLSPMPSTPLKDIKKGKRSISKRALQQEASGQRATNYCLRSSWKNNQR